MKEYLFRLQKVLKAKQIKQDVEQRKLMEEKRILNQQQEELQELKSRELRFIEEMKQKRMQSSRGHELRNYSSYQRQVQKYVDQQQEEVEAAHLRVRRQRQDLLDAAQETQMLDKLKEKDYRKHVQEANLREQKTLDELSQLQPFRNNQD